MRKQATKLYPRLVFLGVTHRCGVGTMYKGIVRCDADDLFCCMGLEAGIYGRASVVSGYLSLKPAVRRRRALSNIVLAR